MPRYTLMAPILNEWENIALFSFWALNTTTVKFGGLNTLILRKYFRQYTTIFRIYNQAVFRAL